MEGGALAARHSFISVVRLAGPDQKISRWLKDISRTKVGTFWRKRLTKLLWSTQIQPPLGIVAGLLVETRN